MKRVLYLVAVLFIASLTSCNFLKSGANLKNDIDSLSYAQGMLVGGNIAPQLSFDPQMNAEQFIKGFKSGLYADSTEYSYRLGEGIGYQIAMNIERDVNIMGARVNKEIFFKAFAAAINEDSLLFSRTDANEIANAILEKLME
jgi:hypothetical protein